MTEYHLADVTIEPDDEFPGRYSVHPVWAGVDRPVSSGWLVRGLPLARRLEAAIRAGAAAVPRGIITDINGKTYVDTEHVVRARAMNADLRKLGF